MEDPYETLGVDADADAATLKRAYRRRVKEVHPDHGGSAAAFQRVRDAYEAVVADAVAAEASTADERDDASATEQPRARVEYLNYDVLSDHDWSLEDEALFESAAAADLARTDYGRFVVEPDETLLEAAENRGFAWPFACRGGACANCAVAIVSGELAQPVDHILPAEMIADGIRLSCQGTPLTDELQVVYNVKHMPDLEELRLPPRPFEQARAGR